MRRAKTIDELYQEVKDYDVVLCNDAPLMTALNNRSDVPRIGSLAVTPRHIAAKEAVNILGEGIWSDLRIVSFIADETGYDIRFVHGEVENIRLIRRYTKDVERYLYGRSRKIYRIFSDLPTEEKAMGSYDAEKEGLFFGRNVAVIGLDLFNDLDKHFIPPQYSEIEMFSDGEFDIETIYEEGNDRQMADDAVDLITPENAEDIAIVMDSSSPLADAVRAALYRKGIPFKNDLRARDLIQVRDYLEFLELSLSYWTVRAGQVRELFSSFGGNIPLEYDDYHLNRIGDVLDSRSTEISDIMRTVRERTFRDVCDAVIRSGSPKNDSLYRSPIKTILNSLGLTDEKVSDELFSYISYAVNNMDLKHNEEIPEDEKKGVILTDCCSSVYVDRPVVIFMGMGQEWYRPVQGKRYVDWEDERERNALRFGVLLQQGSERIYMANSMKNGRPARPCVLFDDVLEKQVRDFSDVAPLLKGGWCPGSERTALRKQTIEPERSEGLFTKSSLNEYMMCPRRFMFSRLVRTPEKDSTLFGTVVHEFAEFCLCYPELVKKNGIEYYVELIEKEYSGISAEERSDVDRCRIRTALANISEFRDSLRFDVPLDTASKNNALMKHHGLDKTSSLTEAKLVSKKTPLYGRFDLLVDGMIVDYKTGKSKSSGDMKKNMSTADSVKFPEFQPIVYLTILDDVREEKKLFRIFNVMGNPKDALAGSSDLDGCFTDVTIETGSFADFVKGSLKDAVYEKYPLIAGNWSAVADRMIELGIPRDHTDWTSDAALQKKMESANNGKPAKRILENIARSVCGWAVDDDESLTILREKMEEFRIMVKSLYQEMTEQRYTAFKGNHSRCDGCTYFGVCTDGQEAEDERSE